MDSSILISLEVLTGLQVYSTRAGKILDSVVRTIFRCNPTPPAWHPFPPHLAVILDTHSFVGLGLHLRPSSAPTPICTEFTGRFYFQKFGLYCIAKLANIWWPGALRLVLTTTTPRAVSVRFQQDTERSSCTPVAHTRICTAYILPPRHAPRCLNPQRCLDYFLATHPHTVT